jgi:hypothetical protein
MTLLKAYLIICWLVVAYVTVWAVREMGAGAAGEVFLRDLSHPWRAQFNSDFFFHLLLIAGWVWYREPHPVARPLCALGSIFGGSLFSFAYILVATLRAGGDPRRLLLGRHA